MSPKQKAQRAKFRVFANQHGKAYALFCQENGSAMDYQNIELLRAFYTQRETAKRVNKELISQAKHDKMLARRMLKTVVRAKTVRFNKGFHLINGDCLRGQEPISDKTQVREPELIVIQ